MPIEHDLYNVGAKEGDCPECGRSLKDVDRRAHSALHYGEEPLPTRPSTRLARQRQAVLLGEKPPEY